MPDDLQSRRRFAAVAARERRGYLGLTQMELANRAGVVLRTIQNLESQTKPVWPNPVTRARIEKALGWPAGELHRLSSPPRTRIDPQLQDRIEELSDEDLDWMIEWLEGVQAQRRGGGARRRRAGA